jgi:hypothetical protein
MITYITSLYAVRDAYLPALYKEFQELQEVCGPILVWTDTPLPFPTKDHVQVLLAPLESFASYIRSMNPLLLPQQRNQQKDTQEFLALMNTKVEMIWRALPYIKTSHVAWIDAGILKIVKDKPRVAKAFQNHSTFSWPNRVAIPGCWKSPLVNLYHTVSWRFCGGFFVCPTTLLPTFYEKVTHLLEAWNAAGHLAWEVNVWADLEVKDPSLFAWWPADHNETMFEPKIPVLVE